MRSIFILPVSDKVSCPSTRRKCDIKRDIIKEIVKFIFALNLFNDNTRKVYYLNICLMTLFSLFLSLEITICPSANQMALNIKDAFGAWMTTCAVQIS